jgi:hypothetical protein
LLLTNEKDALPTLLETGSDEVIRAIKKSRIWPQLKEMAMEEARPSIKEFLELKDDLLIPDVGVKRLVETFRLPSGYRLHSVKKLQREINAGLGLTATKGHGTYIDIIRILRETIERHPPATPKLTIKFAFDGC